MYSSPAIRTNQWHKIVAFYAVDTGRATLNLDGYELLNTYIQVSLSPSCRGALYHMLALHADLYKCPEQTKQTAHMQNTMIEM